MYEPARSFELQLHETLGLTVLMLVALRLLWRSFDKRPVPAPGTRWMKIISRIVHSALFVLLFVVPLSAVAGAWLEGHALMLLGGIQIPPPMAEHHSLGVTISQIHPWLGDLIMWIAGLHASAALYHHLVLKDRVLTSMLPVRRKDKSV